MRAESVPLGLVYPKASVSAVWHGEPLFEVPLLRTIVGLEPVRQVPGISLASHDEKLRPDHALVVIL